jgi:hypothetical protein
VDGGRDYFRAGWDPGKTIPVTEVYDILLDLVNNKELLLPVDDLTTEETV